jgi:DNA-binding transcriptional ArsR family regulator
VTRAAAAGRGERAAATRPLADELVELLAVRLRLLGQPVRIRLIRYLERHGEATVQVLADAIGAGQQNTSRHLGLLHEHGVLARRQEGRTVSYWLADPSAAALVEDAATHIRERLHRLSHEQ